MKFTGNTAGGDEFNPAPTAKLNGREQQDSNALNTAPLPGATIAARVACKGRGFQFLGGK